MIGSRVSCQQREVSEFTVCHVENLSMTFPVESGYREILQSGVISIKKLFSFFLFFRFLLCGVVCVALLAGCVSNKGGGATALLQRDITFKRIAVTPFQAVASGDPAVQIARCPVSGTTFRACGFSGNPEKKLEEQFLSGLNPSGGYTVIPPQEVLGVYRRVSTNSLGETPLDILKKVGKEIGADGIIAGHLFCYRERKGFDYSAEKPASVAFCVHLIRTQDGVSVWKGVFDKTQSSLMENILDILPFIRGGGKWMTAEELSRDGMREILKDFPDMRGTDK
ncbi:MAG: hypothetical protein PHY29_01395 [Syntrophales bacterium]|nr:hypothetical protein [Syntrophales bacterium]